LEGDYEIPYKEGPNLGLSRVKRRYGKLEGVCEMLYGQWPVGCLVKRSTANWKGYVTYCTVSGLSNLWQIGGCV